MKRKQSPKLIYDVYRAPRFPYKHLKSYKVSRGLRGFTMGLFFSAFMQCLMSLVTNFWQIGPCTSTCYWMSGLPTLPTATGAWTASWACGILGIILAFIATVLAIIEFYVNRLRFNEKLSIAIIALGVFAFVFFMIHWIIYIILSIPLQGQLTFSFYLAILGCVMLLIAFLGYSVAHHYGKQYNRIKADFHR